MWYTTLQMGLRAAAQLYTVDHDAYKHRPSQHGAGGLEDQLRNHEERKVHTLFRTIVVLHLRKPWHTHYRVVLMYMMCIKLKCTPLGAMALECETTERGTVLDKGSNLLRMHR